MILGIIGNDSLYGNIPFWEGYAHGQGRVYYPTASMSFSGRILVYVLPILFLCLRKLKRIQ